MPSLCTLNLQYVLTYTYSFQGVSFSGRWPWRRASVAIQPRVNWLYAGAKRVLKGLQFISRTTGSLEAAEVCHRVFANVCVNVSIITLPKNAQNSCGFCASNIIHANGLSGKASDCSTKLCQSGVVCLSVWQYICYIKTNWQSLGKYVSYFHSCYWSLYIHH